MFEIINDHSKHTHSSLLFFFNNIIPVAKACHVAAQQTTNPALKRRYQTYVTDLWNMFPSFCVCADDAAVAFEQFGNSILGAMTDRNYKELSVIICKGLTLLISRASLCGVYAPVTYFPRGIKFEESITRCNQIHPPSPKVKQVFLNTQPYTHFNNSRVLFENGNIVIAKLREWTELNSRY